MPVVFSGPVVTCWRQPVANPAVLSSKPTRNVSNFTNRSKKCNTERLRIDIQNMICRYKNIYTYIYFN